MYTSIYGWICSLRIYRWFVNRSQAQLLFIYCFKSLFIHYSDFFFQISNASATKAHNSPASVKDEVSTLKFNIWIRFWCCGALLYRSIVDQPQHWYCFISFDIGFVLCCCFGLFVFWHKSIETCNTYTQIHRDREIESEREYCELTTLTGRHHTYRRHHSMYQTLVLVLLSLRMRLFNGFIFPLLEMSVSGASVEEARMQTAFSTHLCMCEMTQSIHHTALFHLYPTLRKQQPWQHSIWNGGEK